MSECRNHFMGRRETGGRARRWLTGVLFSLAVLAGALVVASLGQGCAPQATEARDSWSGLTYTNYRIAQIPWSIHVVHVPRSNSLYAIHSLHARGAALGLETLDEQIPLLRATQGTPVAAINADYFERRRTYLGAPRGVQIMEGELLSAPSGGPCFWIDAAGEPHLADVAAQFQITWPDGTQTPFGLNCARPPDGVVLYTPAVGPSTLTYGGRELIVARVNDNPWLPLQLGSPFMARVRAVRDSGNTRLSPEDMVVSVGPAVRHLPPVPLGTLLRITPASVPSMRGARSAIGGGPMLVHDGRRQAIQPPPVETYEFTSMFERHPRTAIGWNAKAFFLVAVDGRQRRLSVGMTLEELTTFLLKLGCQEALNFDGGGSTTLWYDGEVRNSPCDRGERNIANCLVVAREPVKAEPSSPEAPPENTAPHGK